MDLGLGGKRCVVTGASRGIGRAVADLLAAEGARVLTVARDRDALAQGAPRDAELLAADVTAPDAGERIVGACVQRLGGIDVLVNCAGATRKVALDELTDEDWDGQWALNVRGPQRLMAAAAPLMADAGWGRIVTVASSSGRRPSMRNAAYSVTKTAQLALSRHYAEAYAGRGVLVNAVAPGPTASELWLARGGILDQEAREAGTDRATALAAAGAKLPLGRLGEPAEVAAVVAFLCSERAGDVAGATWAVDGGAVPLFL